MKIVLWGLFAGILFFGTASAFETKVIKVKAGDNQALIDAVIQANTDTDFTTFLINIETGPNGETGFVFTEGYNGTNNALPVITGKVWFENSLNDSKNENVSFTGSGERDFRFAKAEGNGTITIDDSVVRDFGVFEESGGAISITGNATFSSQRSRFENNFSSINGGAISCTDTGYVYPSSTEFINNRASDLGGAISVEGKSTATIGHYVGREKNVFSDNSAGVFGCDLNIQTSGGSTVVGNVFSGGNCQNVLIENPFGNIDMFGNTITHGGDVIDSTGALKLFGNLFQGPASSNQLQSVSDSPIKTQATCNDFASGAIISVGYNISADDSCFLDQDSDQPNTDAMLSLNEDGLPVLNPGSPAIDSGSAEIYLPDGADLAILPCGYVDINGVARPQDGNGDGVFECDTGASEFPGTGSVQAGHSGAFYNSLRNGEGNYVEILNDTLAVVYTFTFRPDGSGPAWFIGAGEIRDNSIIIDELARPTGTSFGSGFEPDDIDYSPAGGMSMIFPDCDAGGSGGSVAYSGNEDLGYEGLLSRAKRLTSITGCSTTPTANAGLSGSFYDPARNGEGLIVEWMSNGDVVAIFFTYDQNGDQFWTFGVGTPSGKSVTINAVYPAASTVWGRDFKAGDVDLQPWGTFDLTWTACNDMKFDYSSTVSGYGSGSLNYKRVSSMQGTSCPQF